MTRFLLLPGLPSPAPRLRASPPPKSPLRRWAPTRVSVGPLQPRRCHPARHAFACEHRHRTRRGRADRLGPSWRQRSLRGRGALETDHGFRETPDCRGRDQHDDLYRRRTISLSISEGRSATRPTGWSCAIRDRHSPRARSTRLPQGRATSAMPGRATSPETRPYLERWASDLLRLRTGLRPRSSRRRCDGPRSDALNSGTRGSIVPASRACAPPIRSGSARRFCASSGWMAA